VHPSIVRKLLEDRLPVVINEVAALHEQEIVSRGAEQRSELAESLNQGVRLLRQAGDFPQIASVLADSSANFCQLLAVFSIDRDQVRAQRARGLSEDALARFTTLEFPIGQAAAFAGALHSADPVVAMTTPREISPALAEVFAHKPDDRAYIIPVFVRGQPVGLVYASGSVEMTPIELLAQAAALALEARSRPEPPSTQKPELVTIQGAPLPRCDVPVSWSELPHQEQEIHIRAQRFARVQVAGMRLFSPDKVKEGRQAKDLFSALQKDIEAGRDMFRQMFVAATPTMVDYFHVELLRSLAGDDAGLLGAKYPGPLV
jgi:hypothetical protein